MRAVEAEDVRTSLDHLRNHLLAPRCWAKTRHNLCLPHAVIQDTWLVAFIHDGTVVDLRLEEIASGLCLECGGCLRHDCLEGELPGGGLSTQHYCISAIPDSVLQIAHLGPRRNWSHDHALHHLRRSDDKQACRFCLGNQQLLRERHTLNLHLDTEVTTSNHQGLRFLDDTINVCQCLRLLNLWANLWPLLCWDVHAIHDVNQLLTILSFLCEGDADVLHWWV
mmetsp:Transcript_92386/g.162959  ORF Transcript_92386/g.162959 Transcript_92386/m.162959 type:complete len:223 (-) Transcript_92386:1057-1725(-)